VGVWVGNADGAPMWDVSGVTGAAPVWAALINYLHRRTASREPTAPEGVVKTHIAYQDGVEPSRDDWFLRGTQMTTIALSAAAGSSGTVASNRGAPKIGSPTDGTIFALDPDIPATAQRVWFESAGGARDAMAWQLDGKRFARTSRVAWLPWPGRHTLELVDANGAVLDKVGFEVRGAFAKTPQASKKPLRDPSRSASSSANPAQ
jgi:penicillin-binding protein 1C